MNKNPKYEFDNSFYVLADEITKALEKNKDGTIQEEQVMKLLDLENRFKETILGYKQSTEVYKKFLQKIRIKNKNILSARPYFRENSKSFSKGVTPAIKAENIEDLKKFNINYQLIKFIRDSWLGPFPKKAEILYQKVTIARNLLIENNMPLAVNRAKLFYRKTQKSHLTLMDFIGICSMGLASGVDKWVGKYSPVFRSVCIGRMVGNMIDSYSDTTLHFFPSDRRILYKANAIKSRQGIEDVVNLTAAINQSFANDKEEGKSVPKKGVTVGELLNLMSAAAVISVDSVYDDSGESIYQQIEDQNENLESKWIEHESTAQMLAHASNLPTLHKKVLKMKGLKI